VIGHGQRGSPMGITDWHMPLTAPRSSTPGKGILTSGFVRVELRDLSPATW